METCAKCGHAIHQSKELHYWMDAALCTPCYECVEGKPAVAATSQQGLVASFRKLFTWKPVRSSPTFALVEKAAA